jgi:hypothetical protein
MVSPISASYLSGQIGVSKADWLMPHKYQSTMTVTLDWGRSVIDSKGSDY